MANKPVIRRAVQTSIRRPARSNKPATSRISHEIVSGEKAAAVVAKPAKDAEAFRKQAQVERAKGRETHATEMERWAVNVERAARGRAPSDKDLLRAPAVYSAEGENASWCADLFTLRNSTYSIIPRRDYTTRDALRRLTRHGLEMRAHICARDEIGLRCIRSQAQKLAGQGYLDWEIDHKMQEWRRNVLGIDTRADSTSALSLGSFTPATYFLDQFQIWRSNAAPLLAAASHLPLPQFGMTAYVPVVGEIGAFLQDGENTSVVASGGSGTFSASYASAGIETFVGGVSVSQQAIDRFGPGVGFDDLVAKACAREIATAFEQQVWATILTGAQTVGRSGSPTFDNADLWADAAQASGLAINAPGTAAYPTHTFGTADVLLGFFAQVDSEGRPVWAEVASASPTTTAGRNDGPYEGFTGHTLHGTNVFYNNNIPSWSNVNIVIGAPELALLVLESEPIVDVWPSTEAESFTSFISTRQYCASAVQYPEAFVAFTGTFYNTPYV